jgi:hypothetical protein
MLPSRVASAVSDREQAGNCFDLYKVRFVKPKPNTMKQIYTSDA